MNEKEDNKKWWVRYAIVPILVALLGGTGVFILTTLASPSPSPSLPEPLSPGLPTSTPKPTVVGTPVDWQHTAVEAEAGFVMEANNISFVVDEITAYHHTPHGVPAASGYVYVVVKMRISNENPILSLYSYDIMLIDGHFNQYLEKHTIGFDLPPITIVESNQSVAGALVFNVPRAALNTSLRVRFEPRYYDTRFEVFFDPITDIQP